MPNYQTVHDDSAFQKTTASILPDNSTGQIDAQDIRDMYATLRDRDTLKGYSYTATASLTIDLSAGPVQEILLRQNISSVSFVNAPPFNHLWRSEDIVTGPWEVLANTTRTASNVADPFDQSTADRLTMSAVASTRISQPFQAYAGTPYRWQFYAKGFGGGADSFSIGFADSAGSGLNLHGVDVSASASWGLQQTVWTAVATATIYAVIDNRGNAANVDLYVSRLQVCEANAKSDYVKTDPYPKGEVAQVQLYLKQDSTGSRTVSWGSRVFWENSATPTLSTTAGTVDAITLISTNGGSSWRATFQGQGWGG